MGEDLLVLKEEEKVDDAQEGAQEKEDQEEEEGGVTGIRLPRSNSSSSRATLSRLGRATFHRRRG